MNRRAKREQLFHLPQTPTSNRSKLGDRDRVFGSYSGLRRGGMIMFPLSNLASQPAPPPASRSVVRIGTYSYPRYDRREALEPLAAMIGRVSGQATQIVLLDTPDALADAVCSGDVDVAMTNLGAFVKIRGFPEIKAIAVLDAPSAVLDSYRGVLLSRCDVDVASLDDLAARAGHLHYSEVLPGSTSGALVQRAILRSVKTKPSSFLSVRQAGTHDAALDDLLTGRSDVAAVAEEPWQNLLAKYPALAAQLRLLWRSDPLPVGPVVCKDSLQTSCEAIRSALLGPAGGDVAGCLSNGWKETEGAVRFRAYDPARYDAFRAE